MVVIATCQLAQSVILIWVVLRMLTICDSVGLRDLADVVHLGRDRPQYRFHQINVNWIVPLVLKWKATFSHNRIVHTASFERRKYLFKKAIESELLMFEKDLNRPSEQIGLFTFYCCDRIRSILFLPWPQTSRCRKITHKEYVIDNIRVQ